ncbi:MAG: dihydrolipoyl dehydrogenase [Alphaproteobacteria bacterium]|nr:dihydrolipoyl dehydrogenase [Alphaproteobacteria bacterium]
MAEDSFDVVVVGGGPGGYVCAIRAAQLGLKVACIEKGATLGGTCLNVGCIPSKALLQSSELYAQASHDLAGHGIGVGDVRLDLATMMARKLKVVDDLTKGIAGLFKKNKVTHLAGLGRVVGKHQVTVAGQTVNARAIVIATGSEPMPLKGITIDEKKIVSSTGALAFGAVPKRLVVVGAGIIGLELGSVWRRLGSEVTVVEFLDRIVPAMDGELAKHLHRTLQRQGLAFRLGTKVASAEARKNGVTLTVEPAQGGEPEVINADAVLVAIGRRPLTEGLDLIDAGVVVDNAGLVVIDDHFRTNVDSIYAIGDVVRGPMLAHKAEDEGIAVAEVLAGQAGHVNYDVIPGVIYTHPEAASVGKTEEELKAGGVEYRAGKFSFLANSRGRTYGQTDGFAKILADRTTDRVLGVHVIGPAAGELIAEAAVAMEFGAAAEDIARTCHAHPTFSEAIKEAALAVAGRAIHS